MEFKKKAKNARAFIVLLAAFITEILNIKYNREILDSMITLLVVIIVFFAIGTVALKLVDKIRCMENSRIEEYVPDDSEESVEDEEDAEE